METLSINLAIPKSWNELDDNQLRYIYTLITNDFSLDEIKTLALLKWSGCKVVVQSKDGGFIIKNGKDIFQISINQIAELLPFLDWLDNLPQSPVCLGRIRNRNSVTPDFQGVPFETFLIVENLYQGFLTTKQDTMLDEIAHVLYPGLKAQLSSEERISIFYWIAVLKNLFAKRFSDFFQPVNAASENMLGTSPDVGERLQESMDAQIRALTKGDITKEREILSLDTWRALTELNAQAKEYKQINAQINAKK